MGQYDHDLIENGFETAAVRITLGLGRGKAGWDAYHHTLASVLRLMPGDVCAQEQASGSLGLLRLGEVIHVNTDWIGPEDLTDFDYTPERIVVGIPARTAEAAAQ